MLASELWTWCSCYLLWMIVSMCVMRRENRAEPEQVHGHWVYYAERRMKLEPNQIFMYRSILWKDTSAWLKQLCALRHQYSDYICHKFRIIFHCVYCFIYRRFYSFSIQVSVFRIGVTSHEIISVVVALHENMRQHTANSFHSFYIRTLLCIYLPLYFVGSIDVRHSRMTKFERMDKTKFVVAHKKKKKNQFVGNK